MGGQIPIEKRSWELLKQVLRFFWRGVYYFFLVFTFLYRKNEAGIFPLEKKNK